MRQLMLWLALIASGLQWVACGGPGRQAEKAPVPQPNFLFILADQWRGDAIGAAGHPFVKTPNIDRLAAGGVLFKNAYAPQAVCTPSRASLLTGVYPTTHKLRDNVYGVDSVFDEPEYELRPNYPELLRAAGYFSGYIGKWHLGEKDPGLFNYWNGYNSQWPHWLGEKYESPYRPDVETDDALKFLEQHAGERFFLGISFYPPHNPYEAPKKYHEPYAGLEIDKMEYYAACTAIDANIGRLMQKLDDLGLSQQTMVIFTSEHGESFGKRPLSGNKRVGYEESARVPMIMRYPAVIPAGVVYEGGVVTVDWMPTMLEAASLPIPERTQGKSRIAEIVSGDLGWKQAVFQQNRTQPGILGGPHEERMTRWREWKLIARKYATPVTEVPEAELYNLEADPQERNDLFQAPESREVIADLARRMREKAEAVNDPVGVEIASRYLK